MAVGAGYCNLYGNIKGGGEGIRRTERKGKTNVIGRVKGRRQEKIKKIMLMRKENRKSKI